MEPASAPVTRRSHDAFTSEKIAWFQFGETSHINLTSALILTERATFPLLKGMGNAISPRGDMLKNRVQHHCKDAACLRRKPIPPEY
jgi:hypothetical protein